MNVNGVPHAAQKDRMRPAQKTFRGCPFVKRNSDRRNEAQVTNGAPLVRRQSTQWQCETL